MASTAGETVQSPSLIRRITLKIGISLTAVLLTGAAAMVGQMSAEAVPGGKGGRAGGIGADVAVCTIPDVYRWGMADGYTGYSAATTSVNLGDVNLLWDGNTDQHPRIPQNAFRYAEGRLVQIGQSWCKDGFCALQLNGCGSCQPAGSGCPEILGPGCADPYSSSLNGQQSRLAPRSQCNPVTGHFTYPPENLPTAVATVGRRLKIQTYDLNRVVWGEEAKFFVDAMYLHSQDTDSGNDMNNASYRGVEVGFITSTGFPLETFGNTAIGKPGIYAWEECSDTVLIQPLDFPNDGRVHVASDVILQEDGRYRYEYAIYNYNSGDAVNGFSIPLPNGVTAEEIGFHDSAAHSGEPYATNNWSSSQNGGRISWSTQEYAQNPDANAIRWATQYNFWFVTSAEPSDGTAEIEIFRTNGTAEITVSIPTGSGNPYDLNGDGVVNGADVGLFLAMWGEMGGPGDFNNDGIVNGADFGGLLAAWG